MKISNNWLKEYVDHGLTPEDLAERLTMAGLEVEEVIPVGASLDGVVVGHVQEVAPHPNADRLTLCRVDLGNGEPVQIVCGAPNVAAGQKVPVATVGTTLLLPSRENPAKKEPVTIKKAKLRGEVSEGMICAEDELGLSDDHSGIMVLNADAELGEPFTAYLRRHGVEVQDAVLDVAITPNRPDAVSHLGVARDVGVLTDSIPVLPEVTLPREGGEAASQVSVTIEAPEACPRYVALLVRGVTIKESPAWLKRRLTAVGLRPRNNVVDVTNYVMYECGQPLHAFDFDTIEESRIVVRLSREGESFTTLDGKTHRLPGGTVLICDAERPVAIGGIMGGENSEVTDATTNVLIESAYFDPSTIRRAAKQLGISTDASYRFERGVDRDGQVWAAARAAQLIAELAGGEIVPGMVDAHPVRPEPRVVSLRLSRIARILGTELPREEVIRLLTAIGFEVEEIEPLEEMAEHLMEGRSPATTPVEETLRCTVPTFRPDVEREIDLIEEVARLYGYDRIPEPTHSVLPNRTPHELPGDALRRNTRSLLCGLGYRETYTNSLLSEEEAERFNLPVLSGDDGAVVRTLNAISEEMAVLRPSLLPGLLQVMAFNQNHGQSVLRFFEFGHVFHRTEHTDGPVPGYAEHESLLIAGSGPNVHVGWDRHPRAVDFFDLKGTVEALLQDLRIPDVAMTPVYESTAVTEHHLVVASGETVLGSVARLHEELRRRLDLKEPVYFAELNWDTLVNLATPGMRKKYRAISRFPVVDRDIAVVVDRDQGVGPMLESIREAGQPLLQRVTVFDLYQGERIAAGKKSVAFALRFGAPDRTLTDEEVDTQVAGIVKRLHASFGAELRR